MRASLLAAGLLVWSASGAAADELPPVPSPPAPPLLRADPYPAAGQKTPLAQAIERFDFGDYEAVVNLLRPLVESGGEQLRSPADRVEALRTYGLACTLTGRRTAAEGAFLLLLRAEPHTRFDPTLVRPEAVAFFEEVRARERERVLAAYRKGRPRRYTILNFLPPAGQFQNRQRLKGYLVAGGEVALLATNIASGVLLSQWAGPTSEFKGHVSEARALIPVNYASFAMLLAVIGYGVIDGLVVGHRLAIEERLAEERLQAEVAPRRPALQLRAEAGGLTLAF